MLGRSTLMGGAGVVGPRSKSALYSPPVIMMRWDTGFLSSSWFRRRRRTRSSGISGPTCSGPTGTSTRLSGGSPLSPTRTIGEALLDQRNLAGLGTFYRAELLFLHGVHPRTPVRQVRNLRRIVERGQLLLQANRWRPEQSTTGDLRRGRRSYVYQRSGQPCRRCGTPDPHRGARAARRGTAQLLVPTLPAESMSGAILAVWTR